MHFNAHASSEYMIPTFAMGVMFQCTVDCVGMRVCVQYFVSFSEDCIDEDKCLNKKKKKKTITIAATISRTCMENIYAYNIYSFMVAGKSHSSSLYVLC